MDIMYNGLSGLISPEETVYGLFAYRISLLAFQYILYEFYGLICIILISGQKIQLAGSPGCRSHELGLRCVVLVLVRLSESCISVLEIFFHCETIVLFRYGDKAVIGLPVLFLESKCCISLISGIKEIVERQVLDAYCLDIIL